MTTRVFSLFVAVLLPGLLIGCQTEDDMSAPPFEFAEAWGEPGTEPGQFREPIGIAITDGEVFVSEARNRRVQGLDRAGEPLRQIGPVLASGDTLRRPMHLATADSILYVPDFNTDRVHVLSSEGTPQGTLDPSASGAAFDAPGGVAVDEEGRVYVADFYHHRVLRFGADGTFDRQWGETDSTGKAPDRFTYPTDVATLPDGGFVVADAYNHRIKRYAADGSLSWMWPEDRDWEGTEEGQFNVATAVATGPDGRIHVVDFYNHRIQVFSADGTLLTVFGEQGSGDGQFERPVDLALDSEGTLHVVDFGNDRIQVFAPE